MPAGARGGASAAKKIMANKKKRVDKVDTEEDGKEWMDEFVEATEVLTGQKKVEHNTRASFKLGAIHTGKHTMSPDDRFGAVADWCHRTVESWWFDPFIIFCICIVGIATGVQMSNDPLESAPLWIQVSLDWIGWITLIVFTLEVVLKILAAGRTPVDYFRGEDGPFNRFVSLHGIVGRSRRRRPMVAPLPPPPVFCCRRHHTGRAAAPSPHPAPRTSSSWRSRGGSSRAARAAPSP